MGRLSSLSPKKLSETANTIEHLPEELAGLVREEVRAAANEATKGVTNAGVGVGMFGASTVVAWFGVACLVGAGVAGIAEGLATWLSALIVGVALFAIAGIMVAIGKSKLQSAAQTPENAKVDVRENVEKFKDDRSQFRS